MSTEARATRRWLPWLGAAALALVPATHAAQAHAEILVGRDTAGKLVVRLDASKPYPLAPSAFPGIEGYAEGYPGVSSIFPPRPEEDFANIDPEARLQLVLVAADEGLTFWNDHGTATMRAGEAFELGPAPFDTHPVWNITSGELGKRYALRLKVRDAAGRHGESAVFAAEFTPDETRTVYACPMSCDGALTSAEPGLCSVCGMWLKLRSGRSHRVTVTPEGAAAGAEGIRPGRAATLRFRIESPDGRAVTEFETVHEKLLHLLVVSSDLSWFAHEHPEIQPDGSFVLALAFPHAGIFTLYCDFTPLKVGMQVVPVEVAVAGEPPKAVPLAVDAKRARAVDGYAFELAAPAQMRSIQMQRLAFRVTRDGKPVTDLEPFLGAAGHLIVISEDRAQFVHSHPLAPPSESAARAPALNGPEIVFHAQFPAPAVYKAWGQFQHQGRVITVPFVLEVVSPRGESAPRPAVAPAGESGK